jgi:hypothetical protein
LTEAVLIAESTSKKQKSLDESRLWAIPPTGVETVDGSGDVVSTLGQVVDSRAAESGAVETQNHPEAAGDVRHAAGSDDAQLAALIQAWPMLPAVVKAQIVAMVDAAVK